MSDNPTPLTVELTQAELERLIVVAGDLEFLRSLAADDLPSRTHTRLAAGVMRRLLIDGQLSTVVRKMSGVPLTSLTVSATDIDQSIDAWGNPKWIRFAWAGGAVSTQVDHYGFVFAVVPEEDRPAGMSPDQFVEQLGLPVSAERREMTVPEWLASTSVAIQSTVDGLLRASRRELLKYVANRKGGVHIDMRPSSARPNPRRIDKLGDFLDLGLMRVGQLSGPEFEIASMAHALATTPWAGKLIDAVRERVPEAFDARPRTLKIFTGMDDDGWTTMEFNPQPGA